MLNSQLNNAHLFLSDSPRRTAGSSPRHHRDWIKSSIWDPSAIRTHWAAGDDRDESETHQTTIMFFWMHNNFISLRILHVILINKLSEARTRPCLTFSRHSWHFPSLDSPRPSSSYLKLFYTYSSLMKWAHTEESRSSGKTIHSNNENKYFIG